MNVITIKEVSEKHGVSQDTLRYYERVGIFPAIPRTTGGNRNYQEMDLRWIELALCIRCSGLSVESIAKYVELAKQGDSTMRERLTLLQKQRKNLVEQQRQIADTIKRLDYKISRYEEALKTGILT